MDKSVHGKYLFHSIQKNINANGPIFYDFISIHNINVPN